MTIMHVHANAALRQLFSWFWRRTTMTRGSREHRQSLPGRPTISISHCLTLRMNRARASIECIRVPIPGWIW